MSRKKIVSPINLPESSCGKVSIKIRDYPVGSKLPVITFRTALLTGQRPASLLVTKKPLRVHALVSEDRGTWMTDNPQELVQMYAFAKVARGKVLLGGLGLGLLARFMAQRKAVRSVDIFEIDPDVIKLCSIGLPDKCRVERSDVYKFLEAFSFDWEWDVAVFDTWQMTSEVVWHSVILPLRRLIYQRFGFQKVFCWAEDEMLGQVRRSLTHYAVWPYADHDWEWYAAFRLAAVEIGYPLGGEFTVKRILEASKDYELQELIDLFTLFVGSPIWEATFNNK